MSREGPRYDDRSADPFSNHRKYPGRHEDAPIFQNGLKDAIRGAILGAILTAAIAVIPSVVLFGFQIIAFDLHNDTDRKNDLARLMEFLPTAALAGLFIGAVGGFVAGVPAKGVSLLTGIGIIAACGAVRPTLSATWRPRRRCRP